MDGVFRNRRDAGRQLAGHLSRFARQADVLVLALPRGGVPVAHEVARELDAPLDVFLVRKLGVPGQEELAMGAIASGGVRIVNEQVVRMVGLTEDQIAAVAADEKQELERRDREYRGGRPAPQIEGKTILLVDDGLATGATMRAAAAAVRSQNPARLVVAVPVGAPDTCQSMRGEVDEVVCAIKPDPFYGVGAWYDDFSQTTDEEVRDLLGRSSEATSTGDGQQDRAEAPEDASEQERSPSERTVRLPAGRVHLEGSLSVPADARGVVLFAHGSGSGRHSPRNRFVARELNQAGLATLLIDLLTAEEERVDLRTRHLRFDIGLLAERLVHATDWLQSHPVTRALPVGYFGASTGGGAALVAAAQRPDAVGAVVSRGGRPDLAGDALPHVHAPTLLIVGGNDVPVIGMNEEARARMSNAPVRLEIVPGATHLFEEPGKLEEVAGLAQRWFLQHLGHSPESSSSSPTQLNRRRRSMARYGQNYAGPRSVERGRYDIQHHNERGYIAESRGFQQAPFDSGHGWSPGASEARSRQNGEEWRSQRKRPTPGEGQEKAYGGFPAPFQLGASDGYDRGYRGYGEDHGRAPEAYGGMRAGGWTGRRAGSPSRAGGRVRASDIMTENPETVTPEDTIDLAAQKMRDLDVGILPVVEDAGSRRLVGVVTDRDLTVRAIAEGKGGKTRVKSCMSEEVSTVRQDSPIGGLLDTMRAEQVRRVPVVDDENRLVGIVAQADLAVDYAEDVPERERRVEETIERISQPARPRRHRGGYDREW